MGTEANPLYTVDDLATLSANIKLGVKKMRLNNREIEYQSVSQMIRAKREMEAYLAACDVAAGIKPARPRAFRARASNKGL